MMHRPVRSIAWGVVVCVLALLCVPNSHAKSGDLLTTMPVDHQGKKWRIAYLEGGSYQNYPANLVSIVNGLIKLGWIDRISIPYKEGDEDAKKMWEMLASSTKSRFIEFVPDAFYSSQWDDQKRKTNQKVLLERIKNQKDIDMVLAFGTWAGQDMAVVDNTIPTIVISTSNPVESAIIKSVDDSGHDFIHAVVDPTRYQRQVDIFHKIIGFKKLGVVYEDSVAGRSYAALEDIKTVAKQAGFSIVSCYAKSDVQELHVAYAEVNRCYEKLAKEVDAVYITNHSGVDKHNIAPIVNTLLKHKIPSFSQNGSFEVKHGALLSIAQANFKYIGEFHASVMAKVFNGAKPHDLTQIFENPPKIAINLLSAKQIGFDPSIDLMGVADEIYQFIGDKAF